MTGLGSDFLPYRRSGNGPELENQGNPDVREHPAWPA